jgi:uncharacterized membrane protein (GlpM family)
MTPAGILLRAALGGLLIAILLWLGQSNRPFVSGILLFFPIISLPAFYFVGRDAGMQRVREMIIGGVAAIPVWIVFAGLLYWASFRFRPLAALSLALGGWFLSAAVTVACRSLWFKS